MFGSVQDLASRIPRSLLISFLHNQLYPAQTRYRLIFTRHMVLRVEIPDTINVFLPRKSALDAVKKKSIDEKLEKLGVENGISRPVLQIHAPRAQATFPQDAERLNADERPFAPSALGDIDIGAMRRQRSRRVLTATENETVTWTKLMPATSKTISTMSTSYR
ncbi:hypothetical protein EI94DRAFT_1057957 [Lactarius quietus]|nr:hypothetical protein EI94DRAFT_1057957 [Lactarius quietus]